MDPQQPNSGDEELAGSNPPSGQPDKMLGTSDFISLLGTKDESFYIDKTKLIEVFLKSLRRVRLTAPRHFGKTINLAMMKAFFQLQVPIEEYKTLSEDEFQIKVKETANYKKFQEHQLEITKNSDLMKKHFGKYPVVHISFKCEQPVKSYSEIVAFYSRILSEAFKTHKYLISEESLKQWDKKTYIKWLNNDWDGMKMEDRLQISDGLKTLVKYVFENFNKKIILLIDDYDSVIREAILNLEATDELRDAITFGTGIIQAAVKQDFGENVEYAFITGISHIYGVGLSGSNVIQYRFLENHSFVPYYGLTSKEIWPLLKKTYEFNDEQIRNIIQKCNGYHATVRKVRVKIYNIWSVLEYASKAKENDSTYECQDTECIVGLQEALRFPQIMQIVQTELLFKPIKIHKYNTFDVTNIESLAYIIGNVDLPHVNFPNHHLFFSFIYEQGYLTFLDKKAELVRIPNERIKKKFEETITCFNSKVFGENNIEGCREFFQKISTTECDHDDFKKFHTSLEALLQNYAATWIKKNEDNVRCTMKILIHILGFEDSAELNFNFTENGKTCSRRIDCVIIKDSFLMIIETKYKESNKKAMLHIRDRKYLKVLEDKDVIKNPIKRFVLMGINMDENGQVSISYLQNNHNFDAMTLIP